MDMRDYGLLVVWSAIVFAAGAGVGAVMLGDVWLRLNGA